MSSSSASSHHHHTRPLDALAAAIVVVLCLSWGVNQVSVKLAMHDIPPLTQGAIRSFGATLVVAAWALARGQSLFTRDGTLAAGLACGALFGAEFILIYQGLVFTTATRAVLFIYLAPFFVVLGARIFLPADRFHLPQWAGLALSFAGMLVAFGVPTPALDPRQIIGDVMMVGAAMLWAATTLLIKASRLSRVSSEKVMLYQLVVSGPMLALAALRCRRASAAGAVGAGARCARLSDALGGERHLRGLVRAGGALFGEPALRLHLPDAAVRGRRRPSGAGRAADPGLCRRGGAGRRRISAGESHEITRDLQKPDFAAVPDQRRTTSLRSCCAASGTRGAGARVDPAIFVWHGKTQDEHAGTS